MNIKSNDRRPVPLRQNGLAQKITATLVQWGVAPNIISMLSVLFGVSAGLSLAVTATSEVSLLWWLLAVGFILLRLLANMLDGMVAVQGGKSSKLGELFNEVPDRISDVVILVGAGFAGEGTVHLGYVAALLALFTAYLRTFGNQLGVTQLFVGPMGKSQRMFVLVAVALVSALVPVAWLPLSLMNGGLWLIVVGCIVTIGQRLQRIVMEVNK